MTCPLVLTSRAIPGNGTAGDQDPRSDKQRSRNCVGENISPPPAWSGLPEGAKRLALLPFDPEGRDAGRSKHHISRSSNCPTTSVRPQRHDRRRSPPIIAAGFHPY
jgi:hypothetical protein